MEKTSGQLTKEGFVFFALYCNFTQEEIFILAIIIWYKYR